MNVWRRIFGQSSPSAAPPAGVAPPAGAAPAPEAASAPFPDPGALRGARSNPALLPPLSLAYIGDAVYELYIRRRVLEQGPLRPNELHRQTVSYVRAHAQAAALQDLMPRLTPDEQEIARRGRNAKSGRVPKGSSPAEYAQSSAFEALVGYLYLAGRVERLAILLEEAARRQESTQEEPGR
jgi:ribonuclease III family protein